MSAIDRVLADLKERQTEIDAMLAQLTEEVSKPRGQQFDCFTFRSRDLSFVRVPPDFLAERLSQGRYRITCNTPGVSYLEEPPMVLVQGYECNDRLFCSAGLWTPDTTANSFVVELRWGGDMYDGNVGGGALQDFITFFIAKRRTA